MNPAIPAILGVLLYGGATAALVTRLRQAQSAGRRSADWLAVLALAAHLATFALLAVTNRQLDLSFYDALSLVAALVVLLALAGGAVKPLGNLGVVLFPVAALALLLQLLFGADHQQLIDYAWPIDLHIALAVSAYAILMIGAAQALLLWFQERALRGKRLAGPLRVLPPLPVMEQLLFQIIAVGFGLLTLTLLSGLVFVDDLMAQHLAHKTVLSTLGWLVFGGLLVGRGWFGWRGRTAIRLTLAGMLVLLLAYFGSKLVLELILQRI